MRRYVVLILMYLAIATLPLYAQSTSGKFAFGIQAGGNMWIADYNTFKLSPGGDLFFRYGINKYFSLGLLTGYDVLQATSDPPKQGLKYPYLRLSAIPAAAIGYFHLMPRQSFNPYLFVGAGAMLYQRFTAGKKGAPDEEYRVSYIAPVGVGFESFVGKDMAFTMELGYRNIGDWVDTRKNNSLDGYATARAGLTFYFGSSDADDDDADGLTNGQELKLGTDPKNPDTDGDGLKDGEEVRRYRTNPLRSDTDGDGLTDGDEVLKYATSPIKADTDGDGLSDGDEVQKFATDPLRVDTDGDGLTDGDEVTRYKTNPLKIDTDGDGLTDWDEVRSYKTDPTKDDTDGDGLTDGDEVKKYKTNPLLADTDKGGVNDGDEVKRGTNPLNPADDVPAVTISLERGRRLVLDGINFGTGSATLLAASIPVLEKAYMALSAKATVRVEIAGYTDNVGDPKGNQLLSLRRAESVRQWLVRRGIPATRLTAVGKGLAEPIATNDTPEGRAKNRRIEFHVR